MRAEGLGSISDQNLIQLLRVRWTVQESYLVLKAELPR